jgi:hypothetical protein
MLLKLRNLKNSDKTLLALFALLIIAVIISAFFYKSNKSQTDTTTPQPTVQSAATNDDDTSNDPPPSAAQPAQQASIPAQQTATIATDPNVACHADGMLPDHNCTPGATDSRVTQDTIHQTICVSGYTKTVRPSSSITSKMKLVSMQQYGFTDSPSNYEYDHLISLELGGSPQDTKNLWPEPGASPNPKDKIENKLHSLVCSGAISLSEAQRRISTDWTTALNGY